MTKEKIRDLIFHACLVALIVAVVRGPVDLGLGLGLVAMCGLIAMVSFLERKSNEESGVLDRRIKELEQKVEAILINQGFKR